MPININIDPSKAARMSLTELVKRHQKIDKLSLHCWLYSFFNNLLQRFIAPMY